MAEQTEKQDSGNVYINGGSGYGARNRKNGNRMRGFIPGLIVGVVASVIAVGIYFAVSRGAGAPSASGATVNPNAALDDEAIVDASYDIIEAINAFLTDVNNITAAVDGGWDAIPEQIEAINA